jgi:histidinol-phosphatase (PHP family)
MRPADNHVHSEWSYDTRAASMEQACERAIAIGLPAVAFTEHMDFTMWSDGDSAAAEGLTLQYPDDAAPLDVSGYQECLERCRERFPELRIWSGAEVGEPHLFAASVEGMLSSATFDRVLGSLHAIKDQGRLVDAHTLFDKGSNETPGLPVAEVMRRYFAELVGLVEASDAFEVLAHVDFPRRYIPAHEPVYEEKEFEEEYRAVFRALAGSGRVLEINTRSPLASTTLMRWWHDEGGAAVSFGSDAHVPTRVGDCFDLAVDVVENAGFRPGRDRFDFWRR